VGDSVGVKAGRQTGKEMFKLECEYGDGAVKWVSKNRFSPLDWFLADFAQVIYRELRDFLSLHAHYKAANIGTSVSGLRTSRRVDIPNFPAMSIPYLNRIAGREGHKEKPVGKAEYAQASRDALQQYLVELIRAVVSGP
jgi:phospholipase D1/2